MATFVPRHGWTGVEVPVKKLVPYSAQELKGLAIHWPGAPGSLGSSPSLEQSAARLEAERVDHVAGRGWSDIAYSAAVDQCGRIFDLRGIGYRCAANGDQPHNRAYGAVTFLIGESDTPSTAAIAAFQEWRRTVWLPKWPQATAIVGHRDCIATSCPGDRLYVLVKNGELSKVPAIVKPATEDDMPSAAEVATEVWNRFTITTPEGNEVNLQDALELILAKLEQKS